MKLGSGAYEGPYSFQSRFESGSGTNPEELIGAAEAGCFSMALSSNLEKAGHPAKRISTTANVKLEMVDGVPTITTIDLQVEANVDGMSDQDFQEQAEKTKTGCPVSRALAGTNDKFRRRFEHVEQLAAQRGIVLGSSDLETLDALWDEVKSKE